MQNDFDLTGQVELRGRVLGWLWQEFAAADPAVLDVLEGPGQLTPERETQQREPERLLAVEHRRSAVWMAALAYWRFARGPLRGGRGPATDEPR